MTRPDHYLKNANWQGEPYMRPKTASVIGGVMIAGMVLLWIGYLILLCVAVVQTFGQGVAA